MWVSPKGVEYEYAVGAAAAVIQQNREADEWLYQYFPMTRVWLQSCVTTGRVHRATRSRPHPSHSAFPVWMEARIKRALHRLLSGVRLD